MPDELDMKMADIEGKLKNLSGQTWKRRRNLSGRDANGIQLMRVQALSSTF